MKLKHIYNILLLFILGIFFMSTQVLATPIVDIIPEKPTPQDSIEVAINTNDETVEEVYFLYFECKENDVCSTTRNESLMKIGENIFSTSIALQWEDAAYMQYTVLTKGTQGWNEYFKNTKVTYDTSSSNSNGKSNDTNGTPGFEFLAVVLSIMFISLVLYRRKW